MRSRLYRSETDKMVGGVAGGLGHYLGIDPTLVRLFFVILAIANGIGVLIYIVALIVIPSASQVGIEEREATTPEGEAGERSVVVSGPGRAANPQAAALIGAALIVAGLLFLIGNLNIFWLRWLDFDILWPLLLIAAGAALIWRRVGG